MVEPVAAASAGLLGGFAVAGFLARAALAAARAIARRTSTKRDDKALDELERYLRAHPEAIELVLDLVRRLRG